MGGWGEQRGPSAKQVARASFERAARAVAAASEPELAEALDGLRAALEAFDSIDGSVTSPVGYC